MLIFFLNAYTKKKKKLCSEKVALDKSNLNERYIFERKNFVHNRNFSLVNYFLIYVIKL